MRASERYNPRLDLHTVGQRTVKERSRSLVMSCISNGFEVCGAVGGGVIASKGGVDALLTLEDGPPRFRLSGAEKDIILGENPELWMSEIVAEVKAATLRATTECEWDLARVLSGLAASKFKIQQSTDCHYILRKNCQINLYVGMSPRIHIDGTRRSFRLPGDLAKWVGYIEATHDSSVSRISLRSSRNRRNGWNPWSPGNWK